jgi:hypothetical protein
LSYDLSQSISIVSLLVKLVLVHGIIDNSRPFYNSGQQ